MFVSLTEWIRQIGFYEHRLSASTAAITIFTPTFSRQGQPIAFSLLWGNTWLRPGQQAEWPQQGYKLRWNPQEKCMGHNPRVIRYIIDLITALKNWKKKKVTELPVKCPIHCKKQFIFQNVTSGNKIYHRIKEKGNLVLYPRSEMEVRD